MDLSNEVQSRSSVGRTDTCLTTHDDGPGLDIRHETRPRCAESIDQVSKLHCQPRRTRSVCSTFRSIHLCISLHSFHPPRYVTVVASDREFYSVKEIDRLFLPGPLPHPAHACSSLGWFSGSLLLFLIQFVVTRWDAGRPAITFVACYTHKLSSDIRERPLSWTSLLHRFKSIQVQSYLVAVRKCETGLNYCAL